MNQRTPPRTCQIIPPYLLEKLASEHPDQAVTDRIRNTLERDHAIRERRSVMAAAPATADQPFSVFDAEHGTDLPGKPVRKAGDPETGDQEADEAYAGVEATLALYKEVYGRDSFDGKGAEVKSTVHYDNNYDNAFWNGDQLVFGDGDGEIFGRFTHPVDIIGHEFTHAVTQYTAGLTYQGQSGALNESVSDVFGISLKQRLAGEAAADADWLIGKGIFLPAVEGTALRSMKEPGTAYDDDKLGKDPQVGSMDDYVETDEDNGGVHTNSGIPNKAFYLAATAIGGNTWDGAAKIWYATITSGIGADTDFAHFATATITAAKVVSEEAADAVTEAWAGVKVVPAS